MQSEAQLLEYCHGVAGAIGLMLCPIFEVNDKKAFEHANNLGIAMQLTNICRDVFEDAENDRIYLPADLFSSALTTADLTSEDFDSREACLLQKSAYYKWRTNCIKMQTRASIAFQDPCC